MPRKKRSPPTQEERVLKLSNSRWHLRMIEAFNRRLRIGSQIAARPPGSRHKEVERLNKKYGLSERYLWGTVKLAEKVQARLQVNRSKSPIKRPRALFSAVNFLFVELRSGPRPIKEIKELARNAGISPRTLRRAAGSHIISAERYITKRRIGGAHGHWVWELSERTKKIFMPEE